MMNKVLQFPLVRIVMAVLLVGIGLLIGQTLLSLLRSAFSIKDLGAANVLAFILITPLAYVAYWVYVRYVEKRVMTELGSQGAAREFGRGALLGFGLFSFVIALLWLLGFYHVNGFNLIGLTFVGALLGAFASSFAQELLFRAVIYRITEEWLGTWWAVAISAILFGLIHLTSAGATIFSALAVALQAGVLLGAAYALTHRLWMAFGIHMAWDFANDGIFGVGLAGQTGQSLHGLLQASLTGSDLFTGGVLGVETSIISVIILTIAGMLLLRAAYQMNQFVSRSRKKKLLYAS
jgi:membrane protease YdiL (CAAX protease family)